MPSQRLHPARRRPRVAGKQHPANRAAAITLDGPADLAKVGAAVEDVVPPSRRLPPRRLTAAPMTSAAVLVAALGFAAWFRGEANQLLDSAAKSNSAVVDVGTTAQISGQVRSAVEHVFSYDFARLDDNERAAAAVITGAFARDYRQQFARVRELAPGQQAVVVATVPALAVKVLDGDRAIVVMFIDQQANRGGQTRPLVAAGRLSVTAQRVNGSWKIEDVEPF